MLASLCGGINCCTLKTWEARQGETKSVILLGVVIVPVAFAMFTVFRQTLESVINFTLSILMQVGRKMPAAPEPFWVLSHLLRLAGSFSVH